ncbi:hypothetical protein CHLRE_17g708076v5 [Chlamydomonas reinhardtii]|uniref:Uncharacterized protein n=1 Tax=Chlamydomonas reinhardtii TaxID=3055 RepID=A0A2K3CPF3_CHLRE|nr:uncharacterized protein CHLRE_17g708076v5 [Chlamydomonas reinhardtii]PNW70157.1 hypothetical protein CHLRE_17g708076v5 [Chlamydomonas reinhardtii]
MTDLPAVTLVAPPEPGAWVSHVPLWANPALCEDGRTWDVAFADLFALPGLACVGQLVAAHDGLNDLRQALTRPWAEGSRFGEACVEMYVTAVWRRVLHWSTRARLPSPLPGPASPQAAAARFAAAVALLPAGWAAAARAAQLARGPAAALPLPVADVMSATAESVQQVVRGLGWLQCGGPPIMLTACTVKAGTVLPMAPQLAALKAKHLQYVCDAGVSGVGAALAAGAFVCTLARL